MIAIGQMTEGCAKTLKSQLDGIVQIVVRAMADSHPRVRWAAVRTVALMCTDLHPHVQVYPTPPPCEPAGAGWIDFKESAKVADVDLS